MRLPNQVQSVSKNAGYALHGVNPSIDITCILKCAGSSALKCLYCATSLTCWATCAGPDVVSCISGCL